MKNRKLILAVAVVVVLAGGWAGYQWLKYRPRQRDVEGTVTWVDADQRKASIEFIADWDNERKEKTATVPEDCEILLNGEPADLAQIRAGDQASVKAIYYRKTKELELLEVKVTRPESPTSPTRPATE